MGANSQHESPVAGARASWEGVRTIVWLCGEHDLATADRLTESLAAAAAADPGDLVVDLSDVSFMDASTISAIVRARSAMAQHARRLTVRSPSPLVQRLLGSCGLDELIELADGPSTGRPRAHSALESWVAVAPRDPARAVPIRPELEEARQASRER